MPTAFATNIAEGNVVIEACDKASLDSVVKGLEEQKDHLAGMGRSQPNAFLGLPEIARARRASH